MVWCMRKENILKSNLCFRPFTIIFHACQSQNKHKLCYSSNATKNYLQNQGGHHDSTNIAININSMAPNFLK